MPKVSTLTEVLPGVGDNLRTHGETPAGRKIKCYWIALGSKYAKPFNLLHLLAPRPLLRKILIALLPYKALVEMIPKYTMLAIVDEAGEVIETYQDPTGLAPWMSEAVAFDGYLWWGSWYSGFLARVPLASLQSESNQPPPREPAKLANEAVISSRKSTKLFIFAFSIFIASHDTPRYLSKSSPLLLPSLRFLP